MPGGLGVALVLLVVFVAAVVLTQRELRAEADPRRRRSLLGLRIASAVAALVLAVQPQCTTERVQQVEGQRAILADASRSMTVAHGDGARAQAAAALFERWQGAELEGGATVYEFGAELRPSDLATLAEDYPTRDDESRVVGAIDELLRRDEGDELGAVVVVSDGADATELSVARDLVERGVKVHAVAVGAESGLRDDAIAELQADPVAFLRQRAMVRVVVRSLGQGGPVPVTLRRGEEVVREVVVDVPEGGEAAVELPFTGRHLGRDVYRVSIPVAPGDAVPENNERAFLVRVIRDKLRVLLVAGAPSWDVRFLRAFLERDPSIDLISFFILRTASDLTMASPDELALIPFPTDELFREHLGSFDVVLFQNFDFGPYQMAAYLPRIRDYVRRGGSFAMIGGDRSFGSGGYANTPIADVLPVAVPPANTAETRAIVTGRFQPEVVPELARHPLVALLPDPGASQAAWANVAPLEGANVVTSVRSEGRVLLQHPRRTMAGGEPLPVLVVGAAQEGRVLALTSDTSWRWGMTTGGLRGDASAYERFWDRALRWLARDPALEPARVTTDRERYGPSGRVRVEALLRDERYVPLADREVRLSIFDADDEELAGADVRTDGEGRAVAELEGPERSGGYRVVARLLDAADELADEGFVVEAGGDELADPRPRPELLRAIAEASGGIFVADPADAPSLSAFDATRTRSLGTEEVAPFATLWAFLLAMLIFGTEWVLRRRWGRR